MDFTALWENTLYFIAILNPASKLLFLSAYNPPLRRRQIFELAWKSSAAALVILIALSIAGEFVLSRVFKVEIYSLRISGGLMLFIIGWTAVAEGRFSKNPNLLPSGGGDLTDLSLVPLAAPLIAGPGTIAAAITSTAEHGIVATSTALSAAVAVNFMLMLFTGPINTFLVRTHLQGPLIRLTGLIVATVATQMIATGIREFIG